MKTLTWLEFQGFQLFYGRAGIKTHDARFKKNRFLFFFMVLKAQAFALFYKEHLAYILIGVGPDEFITPGLLDPFNLLLGLLF